jgi:hypothetical protein
MSCLRSSRMHYYERCYTAICSCQRLAVIRLCKSANSTVTSQQVSAAPAAAHTEGDCHCLCSNQLLVLNYARCSTHICVCVSQTVPTHLYRVHYARFDDLCTNLTNLSSILLSLLPTPPINSAHIDTDAIKNLPPYSSFSGLKSTRTCTRTRSQS